MEAKRGTAEGRRMNGAELTADGRTREVIQKEVHCRDTDCVYPAVESAAKTKISSKLLFMARMQTRHKVPRCNLDFYFF